MIMSSESSLSQLSAVQAKLAQSELALRAEIDELEIALQRESSPQKMQTIQEMIAVCYFS